jgi:hypothetical protein
MSHASGKKIVIKTKHLTKMPLVTLETALLDTYTFEGKYPVGLPPELRKFFADFKEVREKLGQIEMFYLVPAAVSVQRTH